MPCPAKSISGIKRLSADGRRGYIPSLLFGAIAQLVERHVRNVEVEGSIPFRSTIHLLGIQHHGDFLFSGSSLIRGKCGKSVALPRLISRLVT